MKQPVGDTAFHVSKYVEVTEPEQRLHREKSWKNTGAKRSLNILLSLTGFTCLFSATMGVGEHKY